MGGGGQVVLEGPADRPPVVLQLGVFRVVRLVLILPHRAEHLPPPRRRGAGGAPRTQRGGHCRGDGHAEREGGSAARLGHASGASVVQRRRQWTFWLEWRGRGMAREAGPPCPAAPGARAPWARSPGRNAPRRPPAARNL
eukprot:gene19128-biopygen17474